MGKKLVILLLILLVLTALSGGYVVEGLQAYSRYQQTTLASQKYCGGRSPVQICVQAPASILSAFYPSYVARHHALFTIQYSSSSPLTLLVSVNIAGFSQVITKTVSAITHMQSLSLIPPVYGSALRKLIVDENTSLQVRVMDTTSHLYYFNDIPLLLRSRLVMQWVPANRLEIAAWVTPDDPAIARLVVKAESYLQSEPSPAPIAMIGYNKASSQAVRDQVDAIFDAMRIDYGISYVQASVPYGGPNSSSAAIQNIKLPAEVLQQQSGMCVELTVLLASAVEHIGLHSEIVIIPGHAFLGVAVTPDNRQFEYWDAVEVNNKVAGDSANLWTDGEYNQYLQQHKIVDTILISDARNQGIEPMV